MDKKVKKWGSSLVLTLKKSEGFKENDMVQVLNKEQRVNIDSMFKDISKLKEDVEGLRKDLDKAEGYV